jgi:hypothetical protein
MINLTQYKEVFNSLRSDENIRTAHKAMADAKNLLSEINSRVSAFSAEKESKLQDKIENGLEILKIYATKKD